MPGLAGIQKQMYPGIVEDAKAADGRVFGVPDPARSLVIMKE